jgi:hypothetical protein
LPPSAAPCGPFPSSGGSNCCCLFPRHRGQRGEATWAARITPQLRDQFPARRQSDPPTYGLSSRSRYPLSYLPHAHAGSATRGTMNINRLLSRREKDGGSHRRQKSRDKSADKKVIVPELYGFFLPPFHPNQVLGCAFFLLVWPLESQRPSKRPDTPLPLANTSFTVFQKLNSNSTLLSCRLGRYQAKE